MCVVAPSLTCQGGLKRRRNSRPPGDGLDHSSSTSILFGAELSAHSARAPSFEFLRIELDTRGGTMDPRQRLYLAQRSGRSDAWFSAEQQGASEHSPVSAGSWLLYDTYGVRVREWHLR